MTYYGAKELAEAFRTVRKNTLQIAEDIPEDKYNFKSSRRCSYGGEAADSYCARTAISHIRFIPKNA